MESAPVSEKELQERRERTARFNKMQLLIALDDWYKENGNNEEKKGWDLHKIKNEAMFNWVDRGHGVHFQNFMEDPEHSRMDIHPDNTEEIEKLWDEFRQYLENISLRKSA